MSAFVLVGFIIAALVVFALMRTTPSGEDVKGSAQKEKFGLPETRLPEDAKTTPMAKTPKARAAEERLQTARKQTDVDNTEEPPETTEEEMKVPARQKGGPTKVYHAPRGTYGPKRDDSPQ